MSSVKAIRETHRARSLCLSSKNRSRYSGARASTKVRQQTQATASPGSKGRSGLNLELDEAKALHGRGGSTGSDSSSSSDEDDKGLLDASEETGREYTVPHGTTIEVPLVDLACVKRSRHLSDEFEIIPHQRGVIALDETDFPRAASGRGLAARLAAVQLDADDEDWELLEVEEHHNTESPKTKSWSKAVLGGR